MNKKITLSVIIPSYNYDHLITHALDSINNQTLNSHENYHIEIIIIDDCSTDNSISTLNQYIKNNTLDITLFKNFVNKGPAVCRNIGIEKATGDYILFLDADDSLTNNSLDKIHNNIILILLL